MAISMGSLTIVDMNDARTLQLYIGSNLAKYQIYNPDNGGLSPDWSSTNLVLTPELYIAGTSSDIITSTAVTSVKWFKDNETTPITTGGAYTISGTNNHILTISQNVLNSANSVNYKCEVKYLDPTTSLTTTTISDIAFTKVSSGGGVVIAVAQTPNGNIFKNSEITSLTGECSLWRGNQEDTTSISYQWYAQDSTVTTDQGGGIGWKKLTNTTGKYTGVTTKTITIYPDAVLNIQTFKCMIKDTDSTSATHNQFFSDFITIIDNQDPIFCQVQSTGGNIFKQGEGSSVLSAHLFQNGEEIDVDGSTYEYRWFKYDKNSQLVTGWGGTTDYKTGKTLNVGSTDVDVKSTFEVQVF